MPREDRMTVDERRKYLNLVAPRYARAGRSERVAVPRFYRGQAAMVEGFRRVQSRLPFLITHVHPDNGSEFFNDHLIRYFGEALKRRLIAFGFDYLIVFSYVLVLLGIGVTVTTRPLDQIHPVFASPVFMDMIAFLVLVLPVILYCTLQESSSRQATWGKRKAGIQVVNARGGRLTRKQAFVRALLKLVPWQIAHTSIFHIEGLPFALVEPTLLVMTGFAIAYVLAGIYAISVLVSKKHRTPYDWAVGSYAIVIK